MVKVERKKRHLSPTTRFISQEPGQEGRLTTDGFRLMKDLAEFISLIEIEDGEITADKISVESLEAISAVLGNVIINGDLVVAGTITTRKMTSRAITDVTVGLQVGAIAPSGGSGTVFVSQAVPISSDNDITGLQIEYTGFMGRPSTGSGNFGYWYLTLWRNGVMIATTAALYYDDNFAYPLMARWFDFVPGEDPVYEIRGTVLTGPGNFTVDGGAGTFTLLKR